MILKISKALCTCKQIVRLVKEKSKKVCLAIGDGENDVVMIKQANVGIGI